MKETTWHMKQGGAQTGDSSRIEHLVPEYGEHTIPGRTEHLIPECKYHNINA